MDISSILTSYDRVRQTIDETHFDLVLEALAASHDYLVIEILPAVRQVWFKTSIDLPFYQEFKGGMLDEKLKRLLLNVDSKQDVRIEIKNKTYDMAYGASFCEVKHSNSDEEN